MKFAVLGTGIVGSTISTKLISLNHEVMMGSRTKENEKAKIWLAANPKNSSAGTFADAATFGEIIFNCTSGTGAMEALRLAGNNLKGKIIIDVTNPLDFSKGMPPILIPALSNTTSLGEEIQNAFPESKVVKAFNTMNCMIMVNPSRVPGDHDLFMCGNDSNAKEKVKEIIRSFGWKSIIDLGDISGARGMEMILPIWIRLYGTFKSPDYNFKVVRA